MRVRANSLFHFVREISVPMTATVAMPAGLRGTKGWARNKRGKGRERGRGRDTLVRRFLFAFGGDATITNNSTLSVNYGALCADAGVYVATTTCSIIVKRAFIFSLSLSLPRRLVVPSVLRFVLISLRSHHTA